MATEHMRDGVTRAIRRGTHHGGGFSCWHTRAVGWAVSVAFTFLPKIEGYGGSSRPFFLYLSSSSPSSFFYLPSTPFLSLFPFLSRVLSICTYILFCFYSFRPFLITTCSRRACRRAHIPKFLLRYARRRAYTCQRDKRGCCKSRICHNGARVKITKKQVKVSRQWLRRSFCHVNCSHIQRHSEASFRRLHLLKTLEDSSDLKRSQPFGSFLSAQSARKEVSRIERSCTAWINQAFPLRQ